MDDSALPEMPSHLRELIFPQQCPDKCFACAFVKRNLVHKLVRDKHLKNLQSLTNVSHVNTEHIIPFNSVACTIIRIKVYAKGDSPQLSVRLVLKTLNIQHQQVEVILKSFMSEVAFYNIVAKLLYIFPRSHFVFPKCYLDSFQWMDDGPPYIVLEDLIADGYEQFDDKLDENHLKAVFKHLGMFHGDSIRLVTNERFDSKSNFSKLMKNDTLIANKDQIMIKQKEAISAFLNNSLIEAVNSGIRDKIRTKLEKVKDLEKSNISLVHGSLTRYKTFYKQCNGECKIKFIGFKTIMLSSPVIDFGRILFTNLPNENDVSKLEEFCRNILEIYLKQIELSCSEMVQCVERQIIDNLLFSYVSLDTKESEAIENHIPILNMLNSLGSLD
ncbi:hypothetical protein DMN91_004507 [Ooceraea biroi]|uniref:CHK kinase-like domain-containing protein n=1 Tax=Ooceraea biroi TaxID=2015173 RepID=A0A026WJP9_OOCBI|nr:uncharacterized protein LOC105279233 [Ooceraea biroi]EZA55344.1 hypothetical protein X777_04798 [Ooceraea biroi]RLU22229.1 hypothetical protein DMN91_004507 [Ooceraea biroi]